MPLLERFFFFFFHRDLFCNQAGPESNMSVPVLKMDLEGICIVEKWKAIVRNKVVLRGEG